MPGPFPALPCRLAAAAVLTAFAGAALAEGPQDRHWAQLEYFFPTISSTARLDFPGTRLPGTTIALEDDLGLSDRKGTPYFLVGTRLGENWRLEFEYYRLDRSATQTTQRTLHWGGATFPLSTTVHSEFDSSIFRLTGGYSFYRTPQAEAGASLGLHITDFKAALSGQGNGPVGAGFQSEKRDATVPLPTVGIYGTYMLADKWALRARADYLSFDYQGYDGSLTNLMAAVDWRFAANWSAGLGYRYVDYDLDSSKDRFQGQFRYKFKGPTLFVGASF